MLEAIFLLFPQCFLAYQGEKTSILSSINAFNVDHAKILSFGKELKASRAIQGHQGPLVLYSKECFILVNSLPEDKRRLIQSERLCRQNLKGTEIMSF